MTIQFIGKVTDSDKLFVNNASFMLPNGALLVVNREKTRVVIDREGNFDMEWQKCYICRSDIPKEDAVKAFALARYVWCEIADEAPDEYRINIEHVNFEDA